MESPSPRCQSPNRERLNRPSNQQAKLHIDGGCPPSRLDNHPRIKTPLDNSRPPGCPAAATIRVIECAQRFPALCPLDGGRSARQNSADTNAAGGFDTLCAFTVVCRAARPLLKNCWSNLPAPA